MNKKITKIIALIFIVFIAIFLCAFKLWENRNENNMHQVTEESHENYEYIGDLELQFATQYSVSFYTGGYVHVAVADGNNYVLVPKGEKDCNLGIDNASIIHIPCENIYLAASSVMDLCRELDEIETIVACSTKAEDYSIKEAVDKIVLGDIRYVGKYSAPDYEKILELDTELAIESTMIYHAPKVKEELEQFGIPVLVERSSYEAEPLGRLEWIKLYGLLLGREDKAAKIFDEQVSKVYANEANKQETSYEKPTVVFFYLSSNGYVNVRKPRDYVSRMIEMAGGEYALKSLTVSEENALSTINISWEDFYKYAKDADILIYNATIDGGLKKIDELLEKNSLFSEFKAVKEGRVYCSTNNLFQETSKIGDIIVELQALINKEDSGLRFVYPLTKD